MATVIPFPLAPSFRYQTVTKAEIAKALGLELEALSVCPTCKGRGVFLYLRSDGWLAGAPCPCGGTDADRIKLAEVCS